MSNKDTPTVPAFEDALTFDDSPLTAPSSTEPSNAPQTQMPAKPSAPLDPALEKQAHADLIAFLKQHAEPGTAIEFMSVDEFMDGLE